MRKHWNNPDTHFNKWNDYPTVRALIGHLISTRRHSARRCCQVNEVFGRRCDCGRPEKSAGSLRGKIGTSAAGTPNSATLDVGNVVAGRAKTVQLRKDCRWDNKRHSLLIPTSLKIKCSLMFVGFFMFKMMRFAYFETQSTSDWEGIRSGQVE